MKILYNNDDLNEALKKISNLGFVPTMGGIHRGHISLINKSKRSCSKTLVSIFVNPRQFNNKRDFKNYPRNNRKDLGILEKLKVNFVYLPKVNEIYDSKKTLKIKISSKDKILCAKFRKGHFEGVIDVMDRLICKIKPKKIFMGEKDYQQIHLVKKYVEKKYFSKIIMCRTIRNRNKLALSSRNTLLKFKDLRKAEKLTKTLLSLKKKLVYKKNIKKFLYEERKRLVKIFKLKIQYLELRNKSNLKISKKIKDSKIFIAYFINQVRLIDNF